MVVILGGVMSWSGMLPNGGIFKNPHMDDCKTINYMELSIILVFPYINLTNLRW